MGDSAGPDFRLRRFHSGFRRGEWRGGDLALASSYEVASTMKLALGQAWRSPEKAPKRPEKLCFHGVLLDPGVSIQPRQSLVNFGRPAGWLAS